MVKQTVNSLTMNDLFQKTKVFAEGLDHPEGVAAHPDGSVWAGGEAGQVYRISSKAEVNIMADTGGFILGLAFSPGSEWLAICDNGKKCIWKLDMQSMELENYTAGTADAGFILPNYPVFDSAGNLYVSDSGNFNQVNGRIFKFFANGDSEIWHSGPFSFTNGMALDHKQQWLYVVSSWLPGVERIRINDDGSAGLKELFCTLPRTVPDGIAFDVEGNLYVTCYTPNVIFKVTPDRFTTAIVEDREAHTLSNPTNIAFGGKDLDQLFTANLGRWHITKIDIGIKGLPLVSHHKK